MGNLRIEQRHDGGPWDPLEMDVWWEKSTGDWTLEMRLIPQQGHAVAGEIRVFPHERIGERQAGDWSLDEASVPPGGLLSKHMTEIRLTSELLEARERLREAAESLETSELWEQLKEGGLQSPADIGHPLLDAGFLDPTNISSKTPAEKRPGRRGHDIDVWLDRAVAYDRACRSNSRHPNKDVAAVIHGLDPADVEESDIRQAAEWVRECRRKGLLGPAPSGGKAGGGLTEEAKKLIHKRERSR